MKRLIAVAVFLAVFLSASVALAASDDTLPPDPGGNPIPGTNSFIHLAYELLNLISTIGIFIVVIAFMVTGFKIVSSQEPRARAEAMHALLPEAVGAFIAFGAKWLASFIRNFAQSI